MKQILWASPTLVDRFGFTVFGDCDFAAVFGCCSPAKLTDSKNEPPVVGAFLIVTSALWVQVYLCFFWWVSRVPGPPYPLVPCPSFFVSLGVWLARVVSHAYADTSQCSE